MRPFAQAVWIVLTLVAAMTARGAGREGQGEGTPAWADAMKRVHARFSGRKGTFAQFGDSITVTQAFWSPLFYTRKNTPPDMERAFRLVKGYLRPECWREWKGPDYGSEGGQTIRWALDNVEAWLKRLNPEVALLMFGT